MDYLTSRLHLKIYPNSITRYGMFQSVIIFPDIQNFWKLTRVKIEQSFESPSSTLEGRQTNAPEDFFYTKFNFEQLLFEPFLHKKRSFGIVEPQIERIFPFLKNKIFLPSTSVFRVPQLHLRGSQTNASEDFFIQNSISNNFSSNLFFIGSVFFASSSLKLNVNCRFTAI